MTIKKGKPMDQEFVEELKVIKSQYQVPNLDRGLSMMELIARCPEGLGITEIGHILELPKNSCFRVAMALHERGFLNRDVNTKKFTISQKLLELGTASTGEFSLVSKSWDAMKNIRDFSEETVLLGTLAGAKGVVLEQVLSRHSFKFQIDPGTSFDLHAAAPAKAIMAFLPDEEFDALVKKIRFKKYTDTTITGRKELREEVEKIRNCGYSIDNEEMLAGCHCVAVPIFDRRGYPIAALWTTGPANRLTADKFEVYGPMMIEQCKIITDRLV